MGIQFIGGIIVRRGLTALSIAFFGVMAGSVLMLNGATCWAQAHGKARVSLSEDWSHRHLVYSRGQAANSANSHPDLRYFQQWVRRNEMSLRNPAAAMPSMRLTSRLPGERGPQRRPTQKPNPSSASRDWSYYLGSLAGAASAPGTFPAKFTFDINAAPSCTSDFVTFPINQSGGSQQASLVAFNNLYAGPIVAASQTGTFTGAPANNQTVTIANGTSNITLTASAGTVATGTITVNLDPSTWPSGLTVTVGSVTYRMVTTVSAPNDVLLYTSSGNGNNRNRTAQNLYAAISGNLTACSGGSICFGPGTVANSAVTAANPNGGVTLTATQGGTSGNFTLSSSNPTYITVSGGNNGSGTNTGTFFQSSANTAITAADLASAIARNGASVGVTATSNGAVVTVTALATGPGGNSIALSEGLNGFTWAGATLTGGAVPLCSVAAPGVMWSYNAATTPVLTSPILSLDGLKVLFVEKGSSGAILHVLKWKSGEGTAPDVPTVPDQSINSTDAGAATSWTTCLGDSTKSCEFNVPFANGANDSNSSPFYDYARDFLYVGDDSGVLHKFSGAFYGTPAEVTTGNWPITVHAGYALTAPVFETNSGNIFVGDSNGQLSYVRETTSNAGACQSGATPCLGSTVQALGGAIVDAPVVDGSTGRVFGFEGTDSTNSGTVYQFDTTLSAASKLSVKVGTFFAGAQSYLHAGTFDNTYYNSATGTGYLYVCGKDTATSDAPAIHRIAITNGLMSTTSAGSLTLVSAGGEECSPVTEIYNSNTGVDWLFFSVGNRASQASCAGAGCVMSLNLNTVATWPPAAVTAGYPTPAGPVNATTTTNASSTSAIVVDNVSSSDQASSIYFTTTSTTTCGTSGGGNVSGCAVKLTQSGLQ